METRKNHVTKFSDLPVDYIKMINEVFATNFDAGLKALRKFNPTEAFFSTTGRIYTDEIVICVSLMLEGKMAATSVYASCDYDAQASSPTIQDVLSACVDAAGAIYGQLLSPDTPEVLEAVTNESLSALENIPFIWTEVQMDRNKVFIKVDKSNPELDRMTDDWLEKNDPDRHAESEEQQQATEKLFVTGPKRGSGTTN